VRCSPVPKHLIEKIIRIKLVKGLRGDSTSCFIVDQTVTIKLEKKLPTRSLLCMQLVPCIQSVIPAAN
jgi:hypothetical protein